MSMFSRFRRGAPNPSASAAEPVGEARVRTPPDPASTALEQEDLTARIAAIDALGFGDALITLCCLSGGTAAAEALQAAAQQRLAALVDSGAVDEDSLANLAIRSSSHAIRRQAAEKVRDPALIARVLKEARGRDNNVYRILKTKRDALLAAERAASESLKRMTALCATIEHHEHQPFTEGFESALDHYDAQWQALQAQAPVELQRRADAAIGRCRHVIGQHREQAAQDAARAAALVEAAAEQRQLLALLHDLLANVYEDPSADVDATLATLQSRWSGSCARAGPASDEQHRCDQLCHAIASLAALSALHGSVRQQAVNLTVDGIGPLQQALSHVPLLGEQIPAAAHEASAALHAIQQAQIESQQSRELLWSQVTALLRKAQRALSAGQSRQAAGMRRAIEQKLRALPEWPPRLMTQLQSFDAQLDVLQDWRSFAVAPKRTELISQMEALVGSNQQPVLLAKRIQQLQDEWRLISKGSTEDTGAEWQRFHDAGQNAYAPCREYFAEQARSRAENLQRRGALLARLQEFAAAHDWEHPDWRQVARALRESRQQWRRCQPVERSANLSLQEGFDAVSLTLQSRLDAEYARNADAMSILILRAQTLAEQGDASQAGDEIRRLQLHWKQLGLVPQEQRARLWEDFRHQCDAVYARQRVQQAEQQALLEANARAATEICEQVEGLLDISGPELLENTRKVSELRDLFAALGTPTAVASRALRARFERAVEQYEARLARERAEARARSWDLVLDAAGRIRVWRLAVATGAAPEACAALHQAAHGFVNELSRLPKGSLPALQSALGSNGSPDIAANEAQLRTLCIRAELQMGLPTPEVDQELRRQFQLQQLLKGLGQKLQPAEGGIEALTLEWIAVGPTADGAYGELLARFMSYIRRT